MKKIFTLIIAAAMAAPVVSAEDVKMSVYERSGELTDGFVPGAFVGYITSPVSYDEGTKQYTITNCLGYDKANVVFKVLESEKVVCGGVTRYGIEYVADTEPAEGSIVKTNGSNKVDFVLNPEDPENPDNPKDNAFRSGVVSGGEDSYQFVKPAMWGITEYTTDAALPNSGLTRARVMSMPNIPLPTTCLSSLIPPTGKATVTRQQSLTSRPTTTPRWNITIFMACVWRIPPRGSTSVVRATRLRK